MQLLLGLFFLVFIRQGEFQRVETGWVSVTFIAGKLTE